MAIAYLNENATSFAAANWDDATGFADAAQLIIADGTTATTQDADQSASDVEYLVVTEGRTGDLGAAGTPLQFEADTPSGARVEYRANGGRFYANPAGNGWDTFIVNSSGGSPFLEGGTVTDLEIAQCAYFEANPTTTITNFKIGGGRGLIDGAASGTTAVTSGEFWGGQWTVRRDGVYDVYGTATVVFDVLDASPATTIRLNSPMAKVFILRGDVATVVHNAGHMATKGERAISVGGTSYTRGPANIATTAFNDIDTIATPTAWGGQIQQIGRQSAGF